MAAGEAGLSTEFLDAPDCYRIELVQWPPGHPDGITSADFTDGQPKPAPTTEQT